MIPCLKISSAECFNENIRKSNPGNRNCSLLIRDRCQKNEFDCNC